MTAVAVMILLILKRRASRRSEQQGLNISDQAPMFPECHLEQVQEVSAEQRRVELQNEGQSKVEMPSEEGKVELPNRYVSYFVDCS